MPDALSAPVAAFLVLYFSHARALHVHLEVDAHAANIAPVNVSHHAVRQTAAGSFHAGKAAASTAAVVMEAEARVEQVRDRLREAKETEKGERSQTVQECSAHFDSLKAELGIRHPREVFVEQPNTSYKLSDLLASKCETVVLIKNKSLFTTQNSRVCHPGLFAEVELLMSHLPASISFVAAFSTSDLSDCGKDSETGHFHWVPATLHESYFPQERFSSQLLLPFYSYVSYQAADRAVRMRDNIATLDIKDFQTPFHCMWRGQASGHAYWQSKFHANRSKCLERETDRECVFRLAHDIEELDVNFGRVPNVVVDFGAPPACLLALDGYGFPGLMTNSLIQGSLTLRVGGYNHNAIGTLRRSSEYTWFEPLLIEGIHYIRTDVDGLQSTLVNLREASATNLHKVAEAGRKAARALFSNKSIDCYSILAINNFATQQQQAVVSEAIQSHEFYPWQESHFIDLHCR